MFCWGKAERGQLGIESADESSYPPSNVQFIHTDGQFLLAYQLPFLSWLVQLTSDSGNKVSLKCLKISAGFNHSAAITEDGAVYVWGKGMSDRLKDSGQPNHIGEFLMLCLTIPFLLLQERRYGYMKTRRRHEELLCRRDGSPRNYTAGELFSLWLLYHLAILLQF